MDPLSFYMVPILIPFVAWAVVAGVRAMLESLRHKAI